MMPFINPNHEALDDLRKLHRYAADQYRRNAGRLDLQLHNANIGACIDKVLRPLQRRIKHGCTNTGIAAAIVRVLGEDQAKWLALDALPDAGAHRGTLFLQAKSSAHAFALRCHLPALKAALAPLGIKEVRMR